METRAPGWAGTGRLKPRTVDWLIVAVLTVLGLISIGVDPTSERRFASVLLFPLAVGLLLVQTVPLAWRRTHPSLVLVLIASAFGIKILLGINTSGAAVGLLIGMYSVAVYGSGRLRVFFLAAAGVGFVAGFVVFAITGNPRSFALSVP